MLTCCKVVHDDFGVVRQHCRIPWKHQPVQCVCVTVTWAIGGSTIDVRSWRQLTARWDCLSTWRKHQQPRHAACVLLHLRIAGLEREAAHRDCIWEGPADEEILPCGMTTLTLMACGRPGVQLHMHVQWLCRVHACLHWFSKAAYACATSGAAGQYRRPTMPSTLRWAMRAARGLASVPASCSRQNAPACGAGTGCRASSLHCYSVAQ